MIQFSNVSQKCAIWHTLSTRHIYFYFQCYWFILFYEFIQRDQLQSVLFSFPSSVPYFSFKHFVYYTEEKNIGTRIALIQQCIDQISRTYLKDSISYFNITKGNQRNCKRIEIQDPSIFWFRLFSFKLKEMNIIILRCWFNCKCNFIIQLI